LDCIIDGDYIDGLDLEIVRHVIDDGAFNRRKVPHRDSEIRKS